MRRSFRAILAGAAGVLCALGACSPFRGESPAPSADAAVGTPIADATVEASAPDASLCDSGILTGLRAFEVPTKGGYVCNAQNALVADDVVAGVDRSDTIYDVADGQSIDGCLAVEFDRPVTNVRLRVGEVQDACGVSPCGDGQCDTQDKFVVYVGKSLAEFRLITNDLVMTGTLHDFDLTLPAPSQSVAVCRADYSIGRDDVAVDAITATCDPSVRR